MGEIPTSKKSENENEHSIREYVGGTSQLILEVKQTELSELFSNYHEKNLSIKQYKKQ